MKLLLTLIIVFAPLTANAGSYRTTATYYSDKFVGRRMANGQRFSQNSNYVAHPNLKLGTKVKIKYKNKTVTGVVKDRCRCTIDLSKDLFRQLAPLKNGRISVLVNY